MSSGAINNWPEDERPREKLLKRGADALSDAELLALVLRSGDASAKRTAIDLGRELLAHFDGNLRALGRAELNELQQIKGLGLAKSSSIKAAFILATRFQSRPLVTLDRFTTPGQVFEYFHHEMRDARKEQFLVLLLDTKNRISRKIVVSEGSLTQSIVHPREVFAPAVRESASAVIFVHNHPSGDPTPSNEDKQLTRRLKEAGELLDIRVLDHVIIGDGSFYSFAESGLL
ncbi:MAG: DNA repair protein RadC [Trichlorobacter sp.]|nr:DNA repair protein RadC [Trichlorobacter sp.]